MGKPASKPLLGVEERELDLESQDQDYRWPWGAAAHESYTQGFPGGGEQTGGEKTGRRGNAAPRQVGGQCQCLNVRGGEKTVTRPDNCQDAMRRVRAQT